MMKKILIPILAGALTITTLMPFTADARRGGGRGMGGGQNGIHNQDRQRLRDGSCLNGNGPQAGNRFKRGKAYGPGNGSGNTGVGPKDGTGYGAPSNR